MSRKVRGGPARAGPRGQRCESLRSFPKEFNHPPALLGQGSTSVPMQVRRRRDHWVSPRSNRAVKQQSDQAGVHLKRAETLWPCRNTGCGVMFARCGSRLFLRKKPSVDGIALPIRSATNDSAWTRAPPSLAARAERQALRRGAPLQHSARHRPAHSQPRPNDA
jgi:hypothetical protein